MTPRHRKFRDPGQQKAYDHYRATSPDPERVKCQGSCGNAYFVGRTLPNPRKPFAVKGSLAYAAWAAGIDNARAAGQDGSGL